MRRRNRKSKRIRRRISIIMRKRRRRRSRSSSRRRRRVDENVQVLDKLNGIHLTTEHPFDLNIYLNLCLNIYRTYRNIMFDVRLVTSQN